MSHVYLPSITGRLCSWRSSVHDLRHLGKMLAPCFISPLLSSYIYIWGLRKGILFPKKRSLKGWAIILFYLKTTILYKKQRALAHGGTISKGNETCVFGFYSCFSGTVGLLCRATCEKSFQNVLTRAEISFDNLLQQCPKLQPVVVSPWSDMNFAQRPFWFWEFCCLCSLGDIRSATPLLHLSTDLGKMWMMPVNSGLHIWHTYA